MCVCLCEYCALLIYFQIKLFIFSWTQPRKWNAMWCGTHKQKWFVCLLSRTHTLAHHENIRKYHHHHLYVVAHFTEQPIFIMCCAVLSCATMCAYVWQSNWCFLSICPAIVGVVVTFDVLLHLVSSRCFYVSTLHIFSLSRKKKNMLQASKKHSLIRPKWK